MNQKVHTYIIVFLFGIFGLTLILLFTFLSSKQMKKKKFPIESLIEIIFAFSSGKELDTGHIKKVYSSKNKTIQICENAIIAMNKNSEKVLFYHEIGLLNSFVSIGAFSINGYGYHIYNSSGKLEETILSTDFDNLDDFEKIVIENNRWIANIDRKSVYDGKLKIPYKFLDNALTKRKKINKFI
ncbi:hypothetical protein [Fusobacterium sp. PH5-44]|uniref:hypothetical protein n=1 Tax=unclassified Fusobacterium TaxID=2648384 RepID=UPI003D24E550